MFARASCEDGRPLCLFCILYALSRPPLPLYHESPFLLPVTGHRFHPLPIRMRQSCLPRWRWYNFAHFVIRDNIPRIRFLHHWRWPLSNEAKPSPKRCSNRGEKLHNRSKAVANLFEYLFEDVETVEIIPCFSRIRVRGSSKAKKQSPSIERRSDPTEDPSIPLNRNPVTRSKTEEILDVNKSDVEANVDLPFGRSHVECYTGAEELLTVQRFYRRIDEQTRHWLIDEAIDSTRFERVTRSRRGICTGTIAISMLALCLLI